MNMGRKGRTLAVFILLIAVLALLSVAAFTITGPMGIEERFAHALGTGNGTGSGESQGIMIEGNPLLYVGIVAVLAAAGYGIYRHAGL